MKLVFKKNALSDDQNTLEKTWGPLGSDFLLVDLLAPFGPFRPAWLWPSRLHALWEILKRSPRNENISRIMSFCKSFIRSSGYMVILWATRFYPISKVLLVAKAKSLRSFEAKKNHRGAEGGIVMSGSWILKTDWLCFLKKKKEFWPELICKHYSWKTFLKARKTGRKRITKKIKSIEQVLTKYNKFLKRKEGNLNWQKNV